MGIFIKVLGCKGNDNTTSPSGLIDKKFVKCIRCKTTYNSNMCHATKSWNKLFLVFSTR